MALIIIRQLHIFRTHYKKQILRNNNAFIIISTINGTSELAKEWNVMCSGQGNRRAVLRVFHMKLSGHQNFITNTCCHPQITVRYHILRE